MNGDGRVPRLCHLVKWPDFQGYGFNLHAERGKAGQYIGKVDEGSPSEYAGLKEGDRIVEVNGVNIGNENHQQVVGRIKSGGDEVSLLVVDTETDEYYKEQKILIRGDLPEVVRKSAQRDEPRPSEDDTNEREPSPQPPSEPSSVPERDPSPPPSPERDPSPEREPSSERAPSLPDEQPPAVLSSEHKVRLCHLVKRADFQGYGFNLHAERDKPGQFIGQIDDDSPAQRADLREGDRIIEVNGVNVEHKNHGEVIQLIKEGGSETKLLVVDKAADEYYKNNAVSLSSDMPNVVYKKSYENEIEPAPESPSSSSYSPYNPRLCHMIKRADFQGYGFNLHAERDKPGQFIGKIDPGSPAEQADLREGDRIIEVNGDNVEGESHQNVIVKIKNGGEETKLLVVDRDTDDYYKSKGITISGNLPEVKLNVSSRGPSAVNGTSAVSRPAVSSAVNGNTSNRSSSSSEPVQNGEIDMTKMSAKEMRELLQSKKKRDPRKEGMSFSQKYQQFQKM